MCGQVVSIKTVRSSGLACGSGDGNLRGLEITVETRRTVELVGLYSFFY